MTNRIALAISTWFGCGYSPKAPGTAGAAGGLVVALALAAWAGFGPLHFLALSAAAFAPFVWAAGRTARLKNLADPQIVVADEVIGLWIALAGARELNWKAYLVAFALFRLFDIWKPAPVRQLERLHGGLGIVADDAMAGCYAALVLFITGWFNLY
jgi:phosphatidylglycerophosphatase A